MISFKSKHYPRTAQSFVILQEHAMRYYGIFMSIVMLLVMLRFYFQKDFFWVAIIGASVALIMGNAAAYATLRRRVAEILFVGDTFSLISVYDIVFKQPNTSFPLRLANPVRVEQGIEIHYEDQVLTLKASDWEDLGVIWDWLTSDQSRPTVTYTIS